MLIIERGRAHRPDAKVPTYSFLTGACSIPTVTSVSSPSLGADDRVLLEAAVTNGAGANNLAQFDEKAFSGRVSVSPIKDEDFTISGGVSTHPFDTDPSATNLNVDQAVAFEVSGEYGNFKSGPHIQAGFVTGDNWNALDAMSLEAETFQAFQGILTYKGLFSNPGVRAVTARARQWADPNTMSTRTRRPRDPGLNMFVATAPGCGEPSTCSCRKRMTIR